MRKTLTTFGKFVILLPSFFPFKSFVILYTELLYLYVIANVNSISHYYIRCIMSSYLPIFLHIKLPRSKSLLLYSLSLLLCQPSCCNTSGRSKYLLEGHLICICSSSILCKWKKKRHG